MKKIKLSLMAACICLSFISIQVNGMSTLPPAVANTEMPAQTGASSVFLNRIAEIEAMDKSNLSFREKRALRKELRAMKQEARAAVTGVYIPIGILIIIIILLIVFL